MKHFLSVSAAVLLGIAPLAAQAAYPDVPSMHENSRAIEYLQTTEIMTGYPDGTFGPDRPLNRAELLKILYASKFGRPGDMFEGDCFPDVDRNAWYAPYVCGSKDAGWVSGYPDGTFRPSQNVSYVEAVKMLVNVRGYELDYDDPVGFHRQGEWFTPYLNAASNNHILSWDTYLERDEKYDEPLSRKRIAEFVYRALWNDGYLSPYLDLDLGACPLQDIVSVKEGYGGNGTQNFEASTRDGKTCIIARDVHPLTRVARGLHGAIMELSPRFSTDWNVERPEASVVDGKAYFIISCECDGGDLPGIFELNLRTGEMAEFLAGTSLVSSDYRYFIGMEGEGRGTITVYDRQTRIGRNAVELEWPMTLVPGMHDQGFGGIGFDSPVLSLDGHTLHYTVYDAGNHSPRSQDDDIADYKKLYDSSVDLDELFGN